MEFKIKKGDFLNLLRWCQGIVEKKNAMPILSNILLETTDKGLRVSATDLEVALVAEGTAEIKKEGRAVLHARNLYEIIREAPEESIYFSNKGGPGNAGLEIQSGKAHFKIVGMKPEEFPNLPQVADKNDIEIEAGLLEEMIEKTYYATATDETRYTLNGLYLEKIIREDKSLFRLVGTDGHRLSYVERVTDKKWKLDKGIIIPRKGIAEVRKLLVDGVGPLRMAIDEKAVLFQRDGVSLTIRLIEGEFPSYDQVIPKKADRIASVDRTVLMGALRRSSIMMTDQGRGVRFTFGNGLIEISSSNPDVGEVKEELAADFKGSNLQIGFNPRYFLDLLNVLEDEKVILELKDEVSPCTIRSEFDRGFLALVMPMRV